MHALELAELSATFAGHSTAMLLLRNFPSRAAHQEYWLEARFRHDFWCSQLAAHRHNLSGGSAAGRRRSWCHIFPVLEEILLSEPLARCVAYHSKLLAERGIDTDLTAVAQSVLSSHVEARHRCLHMIVFGESLDASHSCRLNQLRRCLETYTDTLLGFLDSIQSEDTYSFDPARVRSVQQMQISPFHSTIAKQFMLTFLPQVMRNSIQDRLTVWQCPHQVNERLHAAVLRFMPDSLFDSLGLPISSESARLRRDSAESSLDAESTCQKQDISQFLVTSPTRNHSSTRGTEKPRW